MKADWTDSQKRLLAALGFDIQRSIFAVTSTDVAVVADDRLVAAVLRAAGIADQRDVDAWWRAHALPLPPQLRADPSAKRAIWPRLRLLRNAARHG